MRERNLPSIHLLKHRAAAIGVELDITDAERFTAEKIIATMQKYGLSHLSDAHPLDALLVRGELDDPNAANPREIGARRYSAGSRYAWLRARQYGRLYRTTDLGVTSGPAAEPERPDGFELLSPRRQDAWYSEHFRRLDRALEQRGGRETRAIVVSVCCINQRPTGPHAVELLRRGLDILARTRSPSLDEVPDPAVTEEEARRRFAQARGRR